MWIFTEVADWFDKVREDNDRWIDNNLQPWVGSTLYEDSPWYRNVGVYTASGTLFAVNKFTTTIASGFVDVLRVGDGISEGGWGWGKDALRILSIAGPFFKMARYAGPLVRSIPGLSRLTQFSLTLEPGVNILKGSYGGRCAWVTAARLMRLTGNKPFAEVVDIARGAGIGLDETGRMSILKLAPALRNLGADAKVVNLMEEAKDAHLFAKDLESTEEALKRVLSANPNGAVMVGLKWAKESGDTARHAVIAVRDTFGGVSFIDRSGMAVKSLAELAGKYPGIGAATFRADAVLVQNALWVKAMGTIPTMAEIIRSAASDIGSESAPAPRSQGSAQTKTGLSRSPTASRGTGSTSGGPPNKASASGGGSAHHVVPLSRITGLVLVALDQTPQTAAQVLAEIKFVEPTATLDKVTASLAELQSLGGANQSGTGFTRAPGATPVNMQPDKPK
jgi:hypothetical protein